MSATDILDTKLQWILSIAERVLIQFTTVSQLDALGAVFQKVATTHSAILVRDLIACHDYPFMVIAVDPRQLLVEFITAVRALNSKAYQESLNPVSLCPKLGSREWTLSMDSESICYAVAATPSPYLLKAFACRRLSTVLGYDKFINRETMTFLEATIKEIHPQYDHHTAQVAHLKLVGGARKHNNIQVQKKKIRVRMNITARLIEFIQTTPAISTGIIFVNNLEDSAVAAISLIFTERKYKDAVIEYLKQLIQDVYKDYKFKSYLNSELNVPYDFRLKKFSALITNKEIKHCICLLHLYNIATYDPLPCIRRITDDSIVQVAHPLVKLRLLYTDMYFAQNKIGNTFTTNRAIQNRLLAMYKEVLAHNKLPTWIGYFVNEAFVKNRRNLCEREQPELLLI